MKRRNKHYLVSYVFTRSGILYHGSSYVSANVKLNSQHNIRFWVNHTEKEKGVDGGSLIIINIIKLK